MRRVAMTSEVIEGMSDQDQIAEEPSDKVADLVEYVVCGLVDDVDAVTLDVVDSDDGTLSR